MINDFPYQYNVQYGKILILHFIEKLSKTGRGICKHSMANDQN